MITITYYSLSLVDIIRMSEGLNVSIVLFRDGENIQVIKCLKNQR